MSYFLLNVWWGIQALIATTILLVVGFTPYVFFGFMGWLDSPELDYLARIIGFFIVLWIIMAYCKWDAKNG